MCKQTELFDVNLPTTIDNTIDYTQISPYIATVSSKSPDIDMKKLKDIGVIGVMIEAGALYDSIHTLKSNYRNPKLEKQVQSAVKANLPFALYHDVRSRNLNEAVKELYELQLCIQKYNPILGVWLRLLFNNTKSINNQIVDKYKKHLENLGLKNKIGFYVTRKELGRIDWKDRCNDWLLWLNDHVESISEFERLLDPEIFMLD